MSNKLLIASVLVLSCTFSLNLVSAESPPPNFVVILTDDLGYGDLSCFGSETIQTPNLDRMADEGLKLTSFYAQTVCGPSRAALMTGCYPLRLAINENKVEIHPELHSDEITIAEVLKEVGYTSAAFGKWDLAGHHGDKYVRSLLPLHQGFDFFFGTSTSNDRKVDLIRGDEMIEQNTDMRLLTQRYTDEAIAFMQRSKDQPFFVYLAHSMPHVKLAVSDDFKGTSDGGIYGDVVEEIDFNVGRLLQFLQDAGLDDTTYVIFLSDNGPWYFGRSKGHQKRFGENAVAHGGSSGPLRGAKTTSWEGGLRVPFIVRAPGKVPAGIESDAVVATIDLLPTLAALAGGDVPTDRVIDGRDLSDFFKSGATGAVEPQPYFYYVRTRLEAVRLGKWKLHVPRSVDQKWANFSAAADAIAIEQPMLFNVDADINESNDVAVAHPEVVAELMKHIEHARQDIGDFDRVGANARFFDPQPHRPDIKSKAL